MRKLGLATVAVVGVWGLVVACGGNDKTSGFDTPTDTGDSGPTGIYDEAGNPIGLGGEGGAGDGGLPPGETRDPKDCTEAKTSHSYVGCDYWPTVTANSVWSIFDFAVVVSNAGTAAADITVTGGALGAPKTATVQPGALATIYLPWVPELKGADGDECGSAPGLPASVVKAGGAYHLVSTSPVIVYQFNALEYKGAGGEASGDGGAKDWSQCPGTIKKCAGNGNAAIGCFSFTNDASLLLPSTAMTANYRVIGHQGWTEQPILPPPFGTPTDVMGAFLSVTATADATNVTMTLQSSAKVIAGGGITATTGGKLTFALAKAGDVAEVILDKGDKYDFSGSLVQADKAIQVISGMPCINVPEGTSACDHIEESVIPAETLGNHYVVTMPDKPGGGVGKGIVRFYGNQDNTTLTYNPSAPAGCPTTLKAGQVGECKIASADFEVTGDKEFAASIFTPGAASYKTTGGDPDQSIFPAVAQYRTKYLFLAPVDYTENWADIVGTQNSAPILDGKAVGGAWTKIGNGPFGTWRVKLDGGAKNDGAHTLTSMSPVGVQIMGYGDYTSYMYPGGLNLNLISAPPPPPK